MHLKHLERKLKLKQLNLFPCELLNCNPHLTKKCGGEKKEKTEVLLSA